MLFLETVLEIIYTVFLQDTHTEIVEIGEVTLFLTKVGVVIFHILVFVATILQIFPIDFKENKPQDDSETAIVLYYSKPATTPETSEKPILLLPPPITYQPNYSNDVI